MQLLSIFLMLGQGGQGGSSSMFPLFLGLMILVFWLFMIRPQAKKQKQQKQYIDNLKKGDKVITHAGIHGTISKVNEDGTMHLEVSPGSNIKIEKTAINHEMSVQLNAKLAASTSTDSK